MYVFEASNPSINFLPLYYSIPFLVWHHKHTEYVYERKTIWLREQITEYTIILSSHGVPA